jgi:hypothetical protein
MQLFATEKHRATEGSAGVIFCAFFTFAPVAWPGGANPYGEVEILLAKTGSVSLQC